MGKLAKLFFIFVFTTIFGFGCALSAVAPSATMASMVSDSSMTADIDGHAADDGHMSTAISLPSAPNFFVGFALVAIFLLIVTRRSILSFFKDVPSSVRWLLRTRKEFTALSNHAVFLFRTGIIHPKIF